jgi:uncharacterized protein (TIGR03067 family)
MKTNSLTKEYLAMTRLLTCVMAALVGVGLSVPAADAAAKKDKGWVQLFNGKDLTGWKAHPKNPGKWRVENGVIVSDGDKVSHLFSERDDYENFHYRIEAKISDKGNSGQYFRAQFGPGYPKGYEAQINSTFPPDPQRTGSLYNFAKITEKLVEPDTWFTQEVIAKGNHIQILVNGKKVVDYTDDKNTHTKGHFALQQHSAYKGKDGKVVDTVLHVKKIEVKELPASTGKKEEATKAETKKEDTAVDTKKPDAKKDPAAKDLAKLAGKWKYVKVEAPDAIMKAIAASSTVEVRGDKLIQTITLPDKKTEVATARLVLDPTKKPKTLDYIPLDGPGKDLVHPSIYELTGNTWKIHGSMPGDDRPTDFNYKKSSNRVLFTLVRDDGKVAKKPDDTKTDTAKAKMHTMDDYWALSDKAFKDGKSIVVLVNVQRPDLEKALGDCVVLRLDTFPGAMKSAIVVGIPNPRWLTRLDFPGNVSAEAVRRALPAEKLKMPVKNK